MRKKSCQPNSHIKNVEISNPSQPNGKSEEVGMKLDMRKGKEKESAKSDEVLDSTGGNDTDRVNGCVAVLEAPDSDPASSCSVPAASSLGGYCHHDSAKNSSSILDSSCQPADGSSVSPDLMLDIPPGISAHIPPGFTKAHCQLQMGTAALSFADRHRSLISDIPPGFTEVHRGLPPAIPPAGPACVSTPGTEKKPFVRFSLNVPRPVGMGAPPGFTPLHAVKKEPGLPDVHETADKHTLHSLAAAAAAVVKPGKGGEMKIADNEVKTEQDENSEERDFPKIRRLSDLYCRPSEDSTEFSQRMPARLPDKFQEQRPEKRLVHPREEVGRR